jgi:hypothetical protein
MKKTLTTFLISPVMSTTTTISEEMKRGEMWWENPEEIKRAPEILFIQPALKPPLNHPHQKCFLSTPPPLLSRSSLTPPPFLYWYSRPYWSSYGALLHCGSIPLSDARITTSLKTSSSLFEDAPRHNHHSFLHPPLYLRRRRDLLPHIYHVAVHDHGGIYLSTEHFVVETIVSHLDPSNRHNTTWPRSPEK